MNLKCISHKEYGYTIVVDMDTRQEVELDYEFYPCDCSYPARLVGVSCYYESYKCDKCGKRFTVKQEHYVMNSYEEIVKACQEAIDAGEEFELFFEDEFPEIEHFLVALIEEFGYSYKHSNYIHHVPAWFVYFNK